MQNITDYSVDDNNSNSGISSTQVTNIILGFTALVGTIVGGLFLYSKAKKYFRDNTTTTIELKNEVVKRDEETITTTELVIKCSDNEYFDSQTVSVKKTNSDGSSTTSKAINGIIEKVFKKTKTSEESRQLVRSDTELFLESNQNGKVKIALTRQNIVQNAYEVYSKSISLAQNPEMKIVKSYGGANSSAGDSKGKKNIELVSLKKFLAKTNTSTSLSSHTTPGHEASVEQPENMDGVMAAEPFLGLNNYCEMLPISGVAAAENNDLEPLVKT